MSQGRRSTCLTPVFDIHLPPFVSPFHDDMATSRPSLLCVFLGWNLLRPYDGSDSGSPERSAPVAVLHDAGCPARLTKSMDDHTPQAVYSTATFIPSKSDLLSTPSLPFPPLATSRTESSCMSAVRRNLQDGTLSQEVINHISHEEALLWCCMTKMGFLSAYIKTFFRRVTLVRIHLSGVPFYGGDLKT